MAITPRTQFHSHFISLVTILVSIFLTGFVVKAVSFYFPFSHPEFFGALHLSWTKVAYVAALLLVPPYAWFTWRLLYQHTHPSEFTMLLFHVVSGLTLILLFYFISKLDLSLFYHWSPDKVVTYTHWKTYLLSLFFLALVFLSYRIKTPISRFLSKTSSKIILVIMVIISLYLSNYALLTDTHRYNANALNLSVVMHPVVQVFYGKAVLIDQKTQYGLYAQFLEPVFHLLGGISIFKFSLVMASLIFLSMLAIGVFLLKSVHPVLALIGFCATIYFNYFAGTLWPYELYYQYYPVRTIVPTLTLLFSWFYFRAPSQSKFFAMLTFLSLGIIWNLDVGLFAFVAFVLSSSYQSLFLSEGSWPKIRHLLIGWFQAGFNFALVFGTFLLYLRLRYHLWPTIAEFVSAQKLFLSGAVLAIDRLWTIIILIYLVGLVDSIKNLVLHRPSVNHTMIFLTSILGLGIFTYALNNPHDSVLTNCTYPAVIVLALLVHESLLEWGQSSARLHWSSLYNYKFAALSLALLSILGASFFVNLRHSQVVRDEITIEDLLHPTPGSLVVAWDTKGKTDKEVAYVTVGDLAKNPAPIPVWMNKAAMASRYVLPDGKVRDDLLVLSNWDYLLYLKAHAKSPLISVNFRHLYLENEWQLLFNQIRTRQNRYILVDNEWGLFQGELKNHPNQDIAIIQELLKTYYHPIESKMVGDSWYIDRWYPSEMIMYERN